MRTFTLQELLTFWGITSAEIVGQFVPEKLTPEKTGNKALMGNLMGYDQTGKRGKGKILMHPDGQKRLVVRVDLVEQHLEPYFYYRFKICTGDNQQIVAIDTAYPFEQVDNPYQEIIRKQFYEYSAPKSDLTVALLLNEITNRMYSSNDRVLYEIMQNADDMPTQRIDGRENAVGLEIQCSQSYVFIMHNALPFSQQDVESITSAAQSTKLYDQKKTGYKGIGFKSIFTETLHKVIIRSGGFQFKFDRHDPVFKNFEKMYLTNHPWQGNTTESRTAFLEQHEDRMADFMDIRHIPWQLKPIWVDTGLDEEIRQSNFRKAAYTVSIAIKRSPADTVSFIGDITNVLKDSRFLLYLRNLTEINFNTSTPIRLTSTRRVLANNAMLRETQVTINRNNRLEHAYIVWQRSIECSDEAFAHAGLDLKYSTEIRANATRRIIVDLDGNKRDVPDKVASFSEVQIYFAAPLVDGEVRSESDLANGNSTSFVYSYLPMNDLRIRLPFRISADFVPSSNREQIDAKSVWNYFLFYHIGYQLVKWIAYQAETGRKGDYLKLLLLPLNSGESTIKPIEEWFNKGYQQALSETAFVPDREKTLVYLNQVVINKSPLLHLFDEQFFYEFAGEEFAARMLPQSGLDTIILENQLYTDSYGVKIFTDDTLLTQLSLPAYRQLFQEQLRRSTPDIYLAILNCLNELAQQYTDKMQLISQALTFIRFGETTLSWTQLQTNPDRLVRSARTTAIEDLLPLLGFTLSDAYLSDYRSLLSVLQTEQTYLSDNLKLYRWVAAKTDKNQLTPDQKKRLLDFFADDDFKGVRTGSYADELRLFQGNDDVTRPLSKLLSNSIIGLPYWLAGLVIPKHEQQNLGVFTKHLITENTLFEKVFCHSETVQVITAKLTDDDIDDWCDALSYYDKKAEKTPNGGSIDKSKLPWLCTRTGRQFKSATEVYYSVVLNSTDAGEIIELLTDWTLPHPKSRETIECFDLGRHTRQINIADATLKSAVVLRQEQAILLLDFLAAANNKTKFFQKWHFVVIDNGFTLTAANGALAYTAEVATDEFINVNGLATQLKAVPVALATHPALEKLGVLAGADLLMWLVKNKPVLALTQFVVNNRDNKLSESFLEKLPSISLRSDALYTASSPESQLIRLARRIYAEKDNKTEQESFVTGLRTKMLLDGSKPDSRFYLEDVKVGEKTTFRLSELLPIYADSSLLIDKLERNVEGLEKEDQKFLRSHLFRAVQKKISDIELELRELPDLYLTPLRTAFLLKCAQVEPARFSNPLAFFNANIFDDYFNNRNDTNALNESNAEFLSHLQTYSLNLNDLGFHFHGLDLENLVDSPEAIDTEIFPQWLDTWIKGDRKRRSLLHSWGINGPDSEVVKLRNAFRAGETNVAKELATNLRSSKQLLLNTLEWLYENQSVSPFARLLPVIDTILSYVADEVDGRKYVPVRLPKTEPTYQLIEYQNQSLHVYHQEWGEHTADVLNHIRSENGYLIEADWSGF